MGGGLVVDAQLRHAPTARGRIGAAALTRRVLGPLARPITRLEPPRRRGLGGDVGGDVAALYRRGRCGFSGFISGGIVMREVGSETTYARGGPGRFASVLEHTEEPSSRSAGPRDLSELVARKLGFGRWPSMQV